jgi:hypothetical protein
MLLLHSVTCNARRLLLRFMLSTTLLSTYDRRNYNLGAFCKSYETYTGNYQGGSSFVSLRRDGMRCGAHAAAHADVFGHGSRHNKLCSMWVLAHGMAALGVQVAVDGRRCIPYLPQRYDFCILVMSAG